MYNPLHHRNRIDVAEQDLAKGAFGRAPPKVTQSSSTPLGIEMTPLTVRNNLQELIFPEHPADPYNSEILRQVSHLSSGPVGDSHPSFA